MEYELICTEGIAYIALCYPLSLNKIMFSGSIIDAMYFELPSNNIVLDVNKYSQYILPLEEPIQNHRIKVDIISHNSVCLRVYKIDKHLETEENVIGFKIKQGDLLKIARECLELNVIL